MRGYILAFAISLLFCFGSDIAPYYAASLSHGKIAVLGSLRRFEVSCQEFGTSECKALYRVPRSLIGDAESIGLGIILQPVEIFCGNVSSSKYSTLKVEEQISKYLNSYRTFKIESSCVGDIFVENRLLPGFRRYGYSQGAAIVGSEEWVARTKILVEVFQGNLALVISLLLVFVLSLLKVLKNLSGIYAEITVFDDFVLFGVICINFVYLAEIFVPVVFPYNILVRLSNMCGFIFFSGPVLTFASKAISARYGVQRKIMLVLKPFGNTTFISPYFILCLLFFSTSLFATLYPFLILLFVSVGLIVALWKLDTLMVLFCIAGISDALKILMVPFLPSSRLAMTFIVLVIIYRFISHIRFLLDAIRAETTVGIYAQLAHDIRSPVGALTNLLPHLSGDRDVKEVVSLALSRIRDISRAVLIEYKYSTISSIGLVRTDIGQLVNEVVIEKNIENLSSGRCRIKSDQKPEEFFANVEPEKLKRIISNLINNSMEATSVGTDRVSIVLSKTDSNIVIAISDNGVGFSPDFVKAFSNETRIASTKDEGVGLGLSYAKRILLAWDGNLEIHSAVGVPTLVKLVLKNAK